MKNTAVSVLLSVFLTVSCASSAGYNAPQSEPVTHAKTTTVTVAAATASGLSDSEWQDFLRNSGYHGEEAEKTCAETAIAIIDEPAPEPAEIALVTQETPSETVPEPETEMNMETPEPVIIIPRGYEVQYGTNDEATVTDEDVLPVRPNAKISNGIPALPDDPSKENAGEPFEFTEREPGFLLLTDNSVTDEDDTDPAVITELAGRPSPVTDRRSRRTDAVSLALFAAAGLAAATLVALFARSILAEKNKCSEDGAQNGETEDNTGTVKAEIVRTPGRSEDPEANRTVGRDVDDEMNSIADSGLALDEENRRKVASSIYGKL